MSSPVDSATLDRVNVPQPKRDGPIRLCIVPVRNEHGNFESPDSLVHSGCGTRM